MRFNEVEKVKKEYGLEGNWMSLVEGDNKIRIVSEFEDYGNHFNNATKKSVICIGKENCELCKVGDKPRVQFLGWVIDRKDNKVKLLRIGYQIFEQISNLAKSEDYAFGSVPEYDITIKRSGKGLETDYAVLASRKNSELTEEEKALVLEKIKPLKDIIDTMKAKVALDPANIPEEEQ